MNTKNKSGKKILKHEINIYIMIRDPSKRANY